MTCGCGRWRMTRSGPIDVMLAVINGAGGNMNAHEAALLAWHIKPSVLIPMHHILWKDFTGGEQATLDPNLLVDTYRRLGGKGEVRLLAPGEGITFTQTPRYLHDHPIRRLVRCTASERTVSNALLSFCPGRL